jgi:hypothetical protein
MLLTEDQEALRDAASRFARERLRPGCQRREGEAGIDRALRREMGGLGLVGVDLPEAYGGMGQGDVTTGRLRDVMGLEIGDGTEQVTKPIVARERVGRLAVQYAAQEIA